MEELPQAKHVDAKGVIRATLFLSLPAHLYSSTGSFYRVVRNESELRQFFEDHRAAGASCDVEGCVTYYMERPGEVLYSAAEHHLRADPRVSGLLPGYEGLY